MTCPCGDSTCECGDVCNCCSSLCYCAQCIDLRRRGQADCSQCDGPETCPYYPIADFPDISQLQSIRIASGKRTNMGIYVPEATQGSSTEARKSVPETSSSPPGGYAKFDENLIFQMDDIDSSEAPSTSTGAKSRDSHRSSNSSSNDSVSHSRPFETREPPSSVRSSDSDRLKLEESTKSEIQVSISLQNIDVTGLKLRKSRESEIQVTTKDVAGCSHHIPSTSISDTESLVTGVPPLRTSPVTDFNRTEFLEREIQTTTSIPGCSHHNPNTNISELEESRVIEISPEQKLDATGLKWTESLESEMMINKEIPSCSYHHEYVSKEGESLITDSASYAVLPSEDEYASESLPSNLSSNYSPPFSSPLSPESPTDSLSTSASSTCDIPQPTELKSSEQKTSTVLGTSEQSPTLNLPENETLITSDSHPIDKSRASSESSSSVEILPENMPTGARSDAFHGQPGIPSTFVAPSQSNNTVLQAKSSQPGTSQTLPTSNYLKLRSSEVSKSTWRRPSSESDSSIETISREKDNSEDEAPTNKSPKKNNLM